jgi:hypothetical protein
LHFSRQPIPNVLYNSDDFCQPNNIFQLPLSGIHRISGRHWCQLRCVTQHYLLTYTAPDLSVQPILLTPTPTCHTCPTLSTLVRRVSPTYIQPLSPTRPTSCLLCQSAQHRPTRPARLPTSPDLSNFVQLWMGTISDRWKQSWTCLTG